MKSENKSINNNNLINYYAFDENTFKHLVELYNNASFKAGAIKFASAFEDALRTVTLVQTNDNNNEGG